MAVWDDVYKIINGAKTSVKRDRRNNSTIIMDSQSFKGLPVKSIDEITDLVSAATKKNFEDKGSKFIGVDTIQQQAKQFVLDTAISMKKDKSTAQKIYDSIYNPQTTVNSAGDPTLSGEVSPNIWISPYEANALYSQKGIAEIIVNKKSKSILLNGFKIKNHLLSAKQIDKISANALRLGMPSIIANAVRDSLVYGGDLVFPMFKRDNPTTTQLNVKALVKNGIIGKNQIDYIISLDRWNVMHLPATNPTQKDFLLPEKYYIPYLGSDVHGSRASRLITGDQAGFFGKVMTFGWGLSDFCGYAREMINYKVAIHTLPMMIQQMSILARTINVDGILAQEGSNALDGLIQENTIRVSDWSPNNPVTMDILGKLEVINRDFAEVPSLIRLLRQDLASASTVPEPMLWSSEKGNFASGDDTEGNMAKQYESVKFIHKDVEKQLKNLAMILVIDTLGATDEVMAALPYTEIHFDVPMVANSSDRALIGLNIAKSFFEMVSGQMPLSDAARIASTYGGDELSISSELLDQLDERQKTSDERQTEKFEKEMELLDAQIEQTKNPPMNSFGSGPKPPKKPKKEGGYSRLEQEQHEKTKMPGEKKPERLAKRAQDSLLQRFLDIFQKDA